MIKILLCLLIAAPAFAQHDMHDMENMHHEPHTTKNIFIRPLR